MRACVSAIIVTVHTVSSGRSAPPFFFFPLSDGRATQDIGPELAFVEAVSGAGLGSRPRWARQNRTLRCRRKDTPLFCSRSPDDRFGAVASDPRQHTKATDKPEVEHAARSPVLPPPYQMRLYDITTATTTTDAPVPIVARCLRSSAWGSSFTRQLYASHARAACSSRYRGPRPGNSSRPAGWPT